MPKAIREVYGEALLKYGGDNARVVVLDADVSGSTKSRLFAQQYPERFFNCGIAESAMTGMATGFAAAGKIPFVNAFAVFLSTIASITIRTQLSYSGLNVKLMGAYSGLSAGYDGATHHALEDISTMRSMPGITVMVASDAAITDWMVKTAIERDGPMYIRLSREEAPDCHSPNQRFSLGKGCIVKEGDSATVIACGIMVSEALKAADILAEKGIFIRVVDMFCIKPMDEKLVLESAQKTGAIITAEEHSVIGGLGSAVCESLVKNGARAAVEMIGTRDEHAQSGSYFSLLRECHLQADDIVAAVEKAIKKKEN
ncbi:MAG: transketolase family protein [Acetanaerobacterium sp.]